MTVLFTFKASALQMAPSFSISNIESFNFSIELFFFHASAIFSAPKFPITFIV
eukprot:Pgem_evm1s3831